MKMLKKLSTLILGVAFLCAMVLTPGMESHAEDPTTFYVTYNGGQWFASSSKVDYWSSGLDFVSTNMQDGDHIVVNGSDASTDLVMLKVDKKVGDLVATGGAAASVEAPYVNRAYVAGKGATLIVTAPTVNIVEIYPKQTIQVIGNANTVIAHYVYNTNEYPVFAVTGTVNAANVAYGGKIENANSTIYGIGAGLLKSDGNGMVTLKEGEFSTSPTAPPQAGTTDKAADSSKKQLDKVPQTGLEVSQETIIFAVLALIFASAAVMVGFASKNRN